MSKQTWVIGVLVILLIAIVRSALLQIHEKEKAHADAQNELEKFERVPPVIELKIDEVIQRPSLETHSYWNRDVFLRVTANLTSP